MFSIFIPTINNLPCLKMSIEFIERHTVLPYEILIFDNGSDMDTAKYISDLPHRSIRAESNRGVCKAYNELAKIAKGKYFLLWDDDKLVLPGWDTNILPLIEQDGLYGWKSLVEIWPYGTNPCSVQKDYGRSVDDFDQDRLLKEFNDIDFPKMISLSVSQLMTRELYEVLGGYDEWYYPGFGSDPDIIWRAFCFFGRNQECFRNANRSFYYHFTSATTNRIFRNPLVNKSLRLGGHILFAIKHGFLPRALRDRTGHGRLLLDG